MMHRYHHLVRRSTCCYLCATAVFNACQFSVRTRRLTIWGFQRIRRKSLPESFPSIFALALAPSGSAASAFARRWGSGRLHSDAHRVQPHLEIKSHFYDSSSPNIDDSAASATNFLRDKIRDVFSAGETDGVLNLAPDLLSNHTLEELLSASIDAVSGNKGQAASIINALMGSCATEGNANPSMALALLDAYDDMADEMDLYPDIVTLCVAYTALRRGGEEFEPAAEAVLDRARRLSKKAGGSKRRRALVSARRKSSSGGARATDVQDSLWALYGPELSVLYEDDDALVLSKPSGMVCFYKRKTTAGKVKAGKKKRNKGKKGKKQSIDVDAGDIRNQNIVDISLVDAIVDLGIPLSTLNPDAMGIVHRIDRGTSGCIVLAKNDEAHARLVTAFFARNVKKSYIALVPADAANHGDIDEVVGATGVIDLPVGGQPALSEYEVMARYGKASLLKITTSTGRKHQVRVHCAKGLNRPIFLDPIYSDFMCSGTLKSAESAICSSVPESILQVAEKSAQRFFLHASTLSIPEFGIDVDAPLPPWWAEAVAGLETDNK